MAQNDNICTLFDFYVSNCPLSSHLGQIKKILWVKIPFFRIFYKNLTKMTTVALKMFLQSRVRAQNLPESIINLTYIICKGVKTAKNSPNCQIMRFLAIWVVQNDLTGGEFLEKMVNDYKIT